MATAAPSGDSSECNQLLAGLKQNCEVVKKLVSTAEDFIDCTSFICSNAKIVQIKQQMKSYMNHTAKMQETFEEFNGNLYALPMIQTFFQQLNRTPMGLLRQKHFKKRENSLTT